MYLFYNPTPRNGCFSGISFILLLIQHPAMLRKTVGEKGYVRYKPADEIPFSTPPPLRATSPIFLHCKNTEEEGKYNPFRSLKFGSIPTKFLLSFIPDQ